ncbi:MAG: hypothetical protein K8F91_07365 [Candidatus Obscuribacterales bacterium]|nr:hypothetical protein [Candidatus Obscuribacterales bacterium]
MITNATILPILTIALLLGVYLAAFAGHYAKLRLRYAKINTKKRLCALNAILTLTSLTMIYQGISDPNLPILYPGLLILVFSATYRFSN